MSCSKCKKDKSIKNAFHKLCMECNNERLEAKKPAKVYTLSSSKTKSVKSKETRLKRKVRDGEKIKKKQGRKMGKNFELDEIFYEKSFNQCKIHECEECRNPLPTEFRDDNGKVIARFRYSHIIAKSIGPEIRHDLNNINHLCLACHTVWDFGDKKSMKIYAKNKLRFPQYLK